MLLRCANSSGSVNANSRPETLIQAYLDIHNQILEIENKSAKIKLLKSHEKMDIIKPNTVSNEHSDVKEKMILYSMIMTKKSILEGNPSREYLNLIYNDKKLNHYLHHAAPNELKMQIKQLDNVLIQATP